jgi:phosphatidylserine/phosphatidylglycerophosphate/cardiolipin synthase-like enzyme
MKKDIFIALIVSIVLLAFLLASVYDYQKEETVNEKGSIEVYWCITENCTKVIVQELNKSNNIKCAFYTLKHKSLIDLIISKDIDIVLHEKTYTQIDKNSIIRTVVAPKQWGLMHNKFCSYEKNGIKTILTGSYNPSGNEKKHDIILIIASSSLHKEYTSEYEEMMNKIFAGGKKSKTKEIILTTSIEGNEHNLSIKPAFCPEDNCENKILEEIRKAKEEIIVVAYTYTSEPITKEIIEAKKRGVNISFIIDRGTTNTQGSQIQTIKDNSIPITIAQNYLMHHKIIVIDKTIILGSMNYGKSANTRNDENILIISDSERIMVDSLKINLMKIE